MDPMDQHCRDFMKFVDDCTAYCIERSNGVVYVPLEPLEGSCTYFTSEYGDAVLQYNGAHEEMYRKRVRKKALSEFLTPQGLGQYMEEGMNMCFGSKTPIMQGILKFCSLYLDTASFCYRYQRAELINLFLVSTVSAVFQDYVVYLFSKASPDVIPSLWGQIIEDGLDLVEREKAAFLTGDHSKKK